MMPQSHFAVAAVVTVLAAVLLYPDLDLEGVVRWIVVAGLAAAVIDLDVMLLVRWRARTDPDLRPYTDPRVVARELRPMLVVLHRKGLLVRVAAPHMASALALTVASYYLAPSLLVPVSLGVWSHLVSDVPYVWSVMRDAGGG